MDRDWRASVFRVVSAALVAGAVLSAAQAQAQSQTSLDSLVAEASALYAGPDTPGEDLRRLDNILNRIVIEYPSSEEAVQILLQGDMAGIDVAAFYAALERLPRNDGPLPADAAPGGSSEAPAGTEGVTEPLPSLPPLTIPPATATEPVLEAGPAPGLPPLTIAPESAALPPLQLQPERSEKEIVADIQTELNRLGCNAGSADGVAGRRTRAAFASLLGEVDTGLTPDDLATEAAVTALRGLEGTICTVRVMASTPASALAGSWGFRGDCPGLGNRVIRNTGRMRLDYVGNDMLRGRARNQQGIEGPATIQFQGGRRAATIIKFGFFTLQGNLSRSTSDMTISGTGSRGCRITAWKN